MGDIKISLIVFLVSLILFHALIFLGRTNRQFWVKIDYIWISLGFLGIIGINRDIRQQFNDRQVATSKYLIDWQYDEAIKNAEQFKSFYDPKTTNFQYEIFQDKSAVTAYTNAAIWYGNLTDSLKKYRTEVLEQDNFVSVKIIKKYSDNFPFSKNKFPEMTGVKGCVDVYINEIDKQADIINKIREDESNSEWEFFLKLLSPWLLAIAIALRLSKVTAQLKGIA